MMNYVRKLRSYALFTIYISYNMYAILEKLFFIFIKCLYNDETNKKNSILTFATSC